MRVAELRRYPVKSLGGETAGARRDRRPRHPRRSRAAGRRRARDRDREAQATHGRAPRDARGRREALVAGEPWSSEAAAGAIRAVAGGGAGLVRAEAGHAHDAAPILVVTDDALGRLGHDRRRFRPNVVIAGAEGLQERDWVRGRLRIGGALLFVDEPCERCAITTIEPDTFAIDPEVLRRTRLELGGSMGVYCTVLVPGPVAVGDAAEILA